MPTNAQNIALIRQRLLEPSPQTPSDLQLLNILIEHLNNHSAQLLNTRNHWAVNKFELTAQAEDTPITAQNFGRPFLVYTKDTSDLFHVRREIPFSLMQDMDLRYVGPQQVQSADKHSAQSISFYRDSTGAWFARLSPTPSVSGEYEIWFEANHSFVSLSDTPGLEAFHHLIRVQTALSALPYCEWGALSLKDNSNAWQMRINMLKDGLLHDEAKYQRQFDIYRSQSNREGVSQKLGVGQEYEESWGYGGGRMTSGWGI